MPALFGLTIRFPASRRATSSILFSGMVGFGLSGIVVKFCTPGDVNLSTGLIVCDIFWFVLLLCFGLLNTMVEDYDILEIGGYAFGGIFTPYFFRWKFDIADKQMFVYVPILVDLGIFLAAIGLTIVHKSPQERTELMEGLRSFKELVTNLSLAALCGGGSAGSGAVNDGAEQV